MVQEHGILYAVHIITNLFGDLAAKVCECLLRNGPLSIHAIARRTDLLHAQVKTSLLLLIKHNCVQAFILDEAVDGGESGKTYTQTQYIALFVNILHRARFSKFLDVVTKELGGPCGELLKGFLEHGRLTVNQISVRAVANAKESTNTIQENLHKLVMAHYVERCPVHKPVVPPQTDDPSAKNQGSKSSKTIVDSLTLEQRVMSAAMASEVKRFLFVPNTGKMADDKREVNASSSIDVGQKRKLGDLESDMAVAKEDELMWRANFEELTRRLRHKACVDIVKMRLDDDAAIVLSAMLKGSRTEEKKVKIANSVPLSINCIYEEVVKNEKNHNVTFDQVGTCLQQLSSSPAFVRETNGSYSIDFTQIIEAAQGEEVESLVLRRYGKDAYRMFRLLSNAGCLLETGKIADTVFVEKEETLKTLYKLWQDGCLIMEKLVIGGSAAGPGYGGPPFILWKVNKRILSETVLDEMFHAALNLKLRLAQEIDQNKEVVNLPPEKLEGPDRVKSDKLRNLRSLIHSSLMKVDDAIMLFHDF